MDIVAAIEEQLARPVQQTVRSDLATRHKQGVSSLLSHREDLRGVYAFADIVDESVLWSA